MNINQAKAAAGIDRRTLATRANLGSMMAQVKAGIVAARRAGDDSRAARLSEAKQVFKERMGRNQNRCENCGNPIAPGATHCRLHARPRALPGAEPPNGQWVNSHGNLVTDPKNQTSVGRSKRVSDAPAGGALAYLGLFTAPIQKVMAKWRERISEGLAEQYFFAVAMAVVSRQTALKLPPCVPVEHWRAVWELGMAISEVCEDASKPTSWLLRLSSFLHARVNGSVPSWEQVRKEIKRQGGPVFSIASIKNAAKRMRILTPR